MVTPDVPVSAADIERLPGLRLVGHRVDRL